ncbi:hypothetical protein PanWU01x14_311640, partial [Parasponia andersonii]
FRSSHINVGLNLDTIVLKLAIDESFGNGTRKKHSHVVQSQLPTAKKEFAVACVQMRDAAMNDNVL